MISFCFFLRYFKRKAEQEKSVSKDREVDEFDEESDVGMNKLHS